MVVVVVVVVVCCCLLLKVYTSLESGTGKQNNREIRPCLGKAGRDFVWHLNVCVCVSRLGPTNSCTMFHFSIENRGIFRAPRFSTHTHTLMTCLTHPRTISVASWMMIRRQIIVIEGEIGSSWKQSLGILPKPWSSLLEKEGWCFWILLV